jgi:PilZ domain
MGTKPVLAYPRFTLAATVMVREAGTGAAVLAKLANISLSGCYLETPRKIPESARVRVVLQTSDIHADLWGVVQRCDATGLGIRFTNGTTVEDWKRLESLIKELQDAVPPKSTAVPGSR